MLIVVLVRVGGGGGDALVGGLGVVAIHCT